MHEEVIHIHETVSLAVCHDQCHVSLERWWGVLETKRHDSPFEEAMPFDRIGHPERCLGSIRWVDPDLVVTRLEVKLGEELSFSETMQKVIDSGKWVSILDRQRIQLPVINTEPPRPILLRHHQDRCSPR